MHRRNFLKITLPLAIAGKAMGATASKPDLTFGVIADPQYADMDPKWGRFYRQSIGKLDEALNALNAQPLEFVTTLGDLIETDFKSFPAVMAPYAKLKAPHYPICGNHDFDVADADKGKVLAAMGIEKAYYAITKGKWRFIFLDGTDVALWRHPSDHPATATAKAALEKLTATGAPNAKEWNAAIGETQMKWLKDELDAAAAAGQRVIVFNHYPVFPAGHELNLWNAAELVDLLGKYKNIAAYMNGHNHAGNYGQHGGIHYVNFKGMVETETETAYATVRCFPDRLEIEGYGLEPPRKLPGA